MSNKKIITGAVLAGAVGLAIAGFSPSDAVAGDKEKCYGVVKAGMNGCADAKGTHSCAGQATVDGDPNEWVVLPKGVCAKLANGSLTPAADAE